MNKGIKLRAWDGERIRGVVEIRFDAFNGTPKEVRLKLTKKEKEGMSFDEMRKSLWYYTFGPDAVHLMRYTGFLDKNDVEIYLDDIVKWQVTPLFCEGEDEIFIKPVELSGQMIFPAQLETTEVIGNIYENPELLK